MRGRDDLTSTGPMPSAHAMHECTPPLDPDRHALFLDFDGTFVDFAPHPDAIVLRPDSTGLLRDLSRRLGGALALVSGRRIADLDRFLAPLELPASGVHGQEFRPATRRGNHPHRWCRRR